MFKKLTVSTLTAVALALVGGYLVFGSKLGSYLGLAYDKVVATAEESVPLDVELQRLKKEVADLRHDIKAKQSDLAEARYEVQRVTDEVNTLGTEVGSTKASLLARAKELEAAKDYVKLDGKLVSTADAEARLSRDFVRWERRQGDLERLERTLGNLTRNRDMLTEQLDVLDSQQREMEGAIGDLELALKQLELEQMESRHQDDNSRLSGIKADIAKARKRIEVQREKLRIADEYAPEATYGPSPGDIRRRLEGGPTD